MKWRKVMASGKFAGCRMAVSMIRQENAPRLAESFAGSGDTTTDKNWSQLSGLNRRPTVYKTVALPLS
jgi:hypothetical protein